MRSTVKQTRENACMQALHATLHARHVLADSQRFGVQAGQARVAVGLVDADGAAVGYGMVDLGRRPPSP